MAHNEIAGHGIGEVRRVREAAVGGGSSILTALALSLVLAGGAQAASAPASASASGSVDTVSPGGIDRMTLVRGTAPTFSWGSVAGAESYEVMVYELSDSGRESEAPSLSVSLPGSASSWTPDARQGLEAGREYVWFVRAVTGGKADALSRGRMFTISGAPSLAEVEAAMEVLRRYSAAGKAGESDALTAAPGTSEEFTEPTPALVAPEQEPEPEGEANANAIGGEIPGSLAPLPFTQRGINSTIAGSLGTSEVAVRGDWSTTSVIGTDHVVGYLGLQVGDTNLGEFDGFAVLKALDDQRIGVLGVSAVSGGFGGNYGVVGVSTGFSIAGRFFHASSTGVVSNQVVLGTSSAAIDAQGPIQRDCPSDMDRAGTWCIDEVVNDPANCTASVTTCDNEGKTLCPLEALMICDVLNIRDTVTGSCGDRTDDPITTITRTFGMDTDPTNDPFNHFINWRGNNSTTTSLCSTVLPYFCCRPVSP